jgi:AcrR family transcriptional regulator
MAARPRAKPNKIPSQKRSRVTVESILSAATYILSKNGWAGFTTNKVAEKAGVNIASLYQYFPSKEAIVTELHRRHFEEVQARAQEVKQTDYSKLSLRELLRLTVEQGVRGHQVNPKLHKVFHEQAPRSGWPSEPDWDETAAQLLKRITLPHMRNVPDPEIAGFILRAALHAIIHEAVSRKPEFLNSPVFVEEVITLFERYLHRPEKRIGKRSGTSG